MPQTLTLAEAQSLPRWRRPEALLFLMAFAMPLAFSTWFALLNNFIIEVAGFTGRENGWLHSVREIPGFLSFLVIFLIFYIREKRLGLLSLFLLGIASGVTAWFPSFAGLLLITLISSIGFHYYETVAQSLQLQWLDKERAPRVLGWIVGVGSGASLLAYGALALTWKTFELSYNFVFLTSGGICAAIALFCWVAYPQFEAPTPQRTEIVLRRRYWLYYALQFMSGARRQIFLVFAAFMMVERFGMEVHEVTWLFLINYAANMIFAPLMGRAVAKWGERNALTFEYVGLIVVFLAYGGIYYFHWGVALAACLYVLDHLFFALAFALKTYFQKIADPADIAPTAAVAFTINHIAAVFLPALMGYLWIFSPGGVFVMAACMAATSLALALMMPRHPAPGNETIFTRFGAKPAQRQGPAE